MKFLPLVWRNLWRKKTRTVLTLLSIVVAFVLFGLLAAIKQALTGGIDIAGADRLVVRHKVSIIQMLPETYQARMERIPGVAAAVHQTWFGGIYQDPKNFFMQCPVVPEEFMRMFPEFLLPPEQMKAWLATRTGAIVGRKSAERFHWKIGDKVPIMSPIWMRKTWEFDIVGIFDGAQKNTDTTAMFFRYDYFDQVRKSQNWGKGLVGWYTIRVNDPAEAAEVARRVDAEFENSDAETKTEPEGAFVQAWASQVGDIALITSSILAAVLFTILLVAGNTMSQSVRERAGEWGLLKSLGFTPGRILALILGESFALAAGGGAAGLVAAKLIIARGDPTGGMLPGFFLPTEAFLEGLGLCAGLGLATGLFPALQAMKLGAADALRRM